LCSKKIGKKDRRLPIASKYSLTTTTTTKSSTYEKRFPIPFHGTKNKQKRSVSHPKCESFGFLTAIHNAKEEY